MDTRENHIYDEETTIDLAQLGLALLKKWKTLLLLGIVGALLGLGLGLLPGEERAGNVPAARSREDGALLEQMTVAAQARSRYKELDGYVKSSPFMKLDSQNVYTGAVEYYVPQSSDPDRVSAAFRALLAQTQFRQEMSEILGLSTEADLDKMLYAHPQVQQDPVIAGDMQVNIREKVSLFARVYAPTQEQAQQAVELLNRTLETLPQHPSLNERVELVEISSEVSFGIVSELRAAQNEIRQELNEAHENYTKLEEKFSEEEFDLYQEYVLTGRTGELPEELFPENPLKKPVILAAVFLFLGCGWYAVAFVANGRIQSPEDAAQAARAVVLAYVDGAADKKNPVDRWIQKLERGHFPKSVTGEYVTAAMKKLGSPAILREEGDPAVEGLCQGLRRFGLLSQDCAALSQLERGSQVVLLVHLNRTTRNAVCQERILCAQYGLDLAGIVVVG